MDASRDVKTSWIGDHHVMMEETKNIAQESERTAFLYHAMKQGDLSGQAPGAFFCPSAGVPGLSNVVVNAPAAGGWIVARLDMLLYLWAIDDDEEVEQRIGNG